MDEYRDKESSRRQMFVSVRYYRAVRDLGPVWELEDMRLTESYSKETALSPADALVYAVVHDHRVYAKYLVHHFPDGLTQTGSHCSCPAVVLHVMLSVRYNRTEILNQLLEASRQLPGLKTDVLRGCVNSDHGKTPLHLACELLQAGAMSALLRYGASAQAEDQTGVTPLDLLLEQLRSSRGSALKKRRCLDVLLLYVTNAHFKMKGCLLGAPEYWRPVVGERSYDFLVGRSPQTLAVLAMRCILRHLPERNVLYGLNALPLPDCLKAELEIYADKCTA